MEIDGIRDSAGSEMKRKKLSLTDEARYISHSDIQLQPGSILTYVSLTLSNSVVIIQGDQIVFVHLMITIHLATWLSLTAWQLTARARRTLD
jgi:hypothetical protein